MNESEHDSLESQQALFVDESDIEHKKPQNHGRSPPFHIIISRLINPLLKSSSKSLGGVHTRFYNRIGRESKFAILTTFIEKWKQNVGNDIYPCFRLILPNDDKERQMYGLKEKAIARLLIKVLGISPESEDANSMINYRVPGQQKGAGNFAERSYEIIKKRERMSDYGSMTIDEVNSLLDDLSKVTKTEEQLPIFTTFYNNMNAEEMKWLIRIILRQMHIGITERTLFAAWHPNANALFNVTSSLKRVCWELTDRSYRLSGEKEDISLMSCFQPQLAAFPKPSYDQIIRLMGNETFFIEEKLDGERIQMHMAERGNKLKFFSRRAKDYTYLYGDSLTNSNGSLTKFLGNAFVPDLENCILDGEMVSWDPVDATIEPFGSLKSAALAELENSGTSYPLYRVFDVLYANGHSTVKYSLAERRKLLDSILIPVPTHFEVHQYEEASTKADIEQRLRQVIAESSEGLVIKRPESTYTVNGRTDDWIKVKPEYMQEFGENLDCLVIGGYYGQGKRGQAIASFLCGLRVENDDDPETIPKFWSFCRVGGGFTANDYATIRHLTENYWQKYDPKKPPTEYIELGGDRNDKEMPDVWIRPDKSVVLEVKAASIVPASEQYRMNVTLRFPRFRRIRQDKDYRSALSVKEFLVLKLQVESEAQEKKLEMESHRRQIKRQKREITILDTRKVASFHGEADSDIFAGLKFCVLVESKRKAPLEKLITGNGGSVVPVVPADLRHGTYVIADKDLVPVAILKRKGNANMILPQWIHDCIFNKRVVPVEPGHLYSATSHLLDRVRRHVDSFGDSYSRCIETSKEMQQIIEGMPDSSNANRNQTDEFLRSEANICNLPSFLFRGMTVYMDLPEQSTASNLPTYSVAKDTLFRCQLATNYVLFGGAQLADSIDNPEISHIVILPDSKDLHSKERVQLIQKIISKRTPIPRLIKLDWITQSWQESTRLPEENFAI